MSGGKSDTDRRNSLEVSASRQVQQAQAGWYQCRCPSAGNPRLAVQLAMPLVSESLHQQGLSGRQTRANNPTTRATVKKSNLRTSRHVPFRRTLFVACHRRSQRQQTHHGRDLQARCCAPCRRPWLSFPRRRRGRFQAPASRPLPFSATASSRSSPSLRCRRREPSWLFPCCPPRAAIGRGSRRRPSVCVFGTGYGPTTSISAQAMSRPRPRLESPLPRSAACVRADARAAGCEGGMEGPRAI